jgi:hypothetical protein
MTNNPKHPNSGAEAPVVAEGRMLRHSKAILYALLGAIVFSLTLLNPLYKAIDIRWQISQLRSDSWDKRREAIHKLDAYGPQARPAIKALATLLKDANPKLESRRIGVRTLDADTPDTLREDAAYALKRIVTKPDVIEILSELLEAAKSPSFGVRNSVFGVAVKGGEPALSVLVELANSGDRRAFDELARLGRPLSAITIPNHVTTIGNNSFDQCTNLTSVTIGNSVTNVGGFDKCSSLTNVTIGTNVTTIGTVAFFGCHALTSITIPESVTTIHYGAFAACTSLTNVMIGNRVANIGNNAFSGCTSLTSVTIPDSVTNIGAQAFSSCSSLTNVMIGTNVASIGNDAFASCTRLTAICFEGNAPRVDPAAFSSANKATIYYLEGTKGWGPTFGGRPTAIWKR